MNLLWVGLLAPLLGFLFLVGGSKWIGRKLAGRLACATILISFLSFVVLLCQKVEGSFLLFKWIPIEGFETNFTLQLDSLSLLMSLIITGVGYLIHLYSIGYMDHDEDFARYFACLNFFIFAMLLLVLAGNLLLLFVGWEGVGLASYLLIGFWYHRPSAAKAATKAFIVNRIGDLGLLLGILLTFSLFGTGDIETISQKAPELFSVGAPIITLLTLLYFVGAVGKSAQIPLHVWLPDAMEGPTPVSALIHAATMVTAGVYLVVRLHPLFQLAPTTLLVIATIGIATALFAATIGMAQRDLKKVLAYSTVSQLGLMFLACGVGAFYAAMFHLTMHAFVKALLFLAAGNVIHMMHGTTDMEKMGGLTGKFPKTHLLFLIGALALGGIPPLAAFFSKDLLLDQAHHLGYPILFYLGLLVSVLTAFYLMRAYFLTFSQKPRLEEKILKVVKEAPWVMILPVAILGFLSLTGGLLGWGGKELSPLEKLLNPFFLGHVVSFQWGVLTFISIAAALVGVFSAWWLYKAKEKQMAGPLFFQKAYFVDEIYDALIVKPLRAVARFTAHILEPHFFDGMVRAIATTTQVTAGWLQKVQSGQVRSYVAWITLGTVCLFLYLVF